MAIALIRLLAVSLILSVPSCSVVKKTARTAADAAHILCELWAQDAGGEQTLGLSPAEFCAIEANARPFIDAALAAQRNAGSAVGARMGIAPKAEEQPAPPAPTPPAPASEPQAAPPAPTTTEQPQQSSMSYPRLGYLPDPPDVRDLELRALSLPRVFPSAFTLRQHVRTVLNQGNSNTCVGNALAQAISIAESFAGVEIEMPSRLFIYNNSLRQHQTGFVLTDSGTFIRTAVAGLQKLGAPPESDWPFSDSVLRVTRRPVFQAYMRAHGRRGGAYYRITDVGSDRTEAIKAAIYAGMPPVFGTRVPKSFLDPNGPTIIHRPSSSEPMAGGHAMVLIGWETNSKQQTLFEAAQSWDTDWRDSGFCKFTEDYILWPFTNDIWCVRGWEVMRHAAPVQPC